MNATATRSTRQTTAAQAAASDVSIPPPAPSFDSERRAAELESRISLGALPRIGDALQGGYYAGMLSDATGAPYALLLLPRPLELEADWHSAKAWAQTQDGDLPNRCEAAMLLSSFHRTLQGSGLIWTNEEYRRTPSHAWLFYGTGGRTVAEDKRMAALALAVRRLPINLGGGTLDPVRPKDTPRDGTALSLPHFSTDVVEVQDDASAVAALNSEDVAAVSATVLFMEMSLGRLDDGLSDEEREAMVQARAHLDAAKRAMSKLMTQLRHEATIGG